MLIHFFSQGKILNGNTIAFFLIEMEYLTTARRLVNTVADWMAERKSSATKRKNKNVSRKLYSLYRYSNKVCEQDNKKVARGGGGPGGWWGGYHPSPKSLLPHIPRCFSFSNPLILFVHLHKLSAGKRVEIKLLRRWTQLGAKKSIFFFPNSMIRLNSHSNIAWNISGRSYI